MYMKISGLVISLTAAISGQVLAAVPQGYPADYQKVVDAGIKEGKVVIYSTTDTKAAGPLIKGFEAQYPGIKVEYNDMNSTELYNRYISEQAAGGGSGDVVWSSSMDTALKLATDYAEEYASPERDKLPKWAVWQQKAYGTTYEPVVFIYNKRLIPQGEVPDSHTALAKLIAGQADKFKGKVTTYDIEKSGLGFMLAVQDSKADASYFDDLAGIAKGGLTVQSSTGTMMERVSSGENLIGYNILGSYAEARAKTILRSASPIRKIMYWCSRGSLLLPQKPSTLMPRSCGLITCCRKRGKASWRTRPIFPPCAMISKGKMISTV